MIPVILSGGSGSRLWPLSRQLYPKQFLPLTGEQSLFQQTLQRLDHEMIEAPIVICNQEHRFIVGEQLRLAGRRAQSILLEPFGRNTAPAVAIAAQQLVSMGRGDELMLVLPADHLITDQAAFLQALNVAQGAAEAGELVLFGIRPERPETGYGYVKCGQGNRLDEASGVLPVERFVEKPDHARACEFVESGAYFWNSGMFLFRASRYLEELRQHEPDIHETCQLAWSQSQSDFEFVRIDAEAFAFCPDRSIDYAVMEKTTRARLVPLSAGWSDVGAWSSLWEVGPKDEQGNVLKGDVLVHDSHNCYVHGSSKLVSLVGLEDVVVVETKDAVMVARKDRVQDIKHLVNQLQQQGRPEARNHREVFRPWGSYDSVDMGRRFQVKRIHVRPGASLSLQKHHHRAEHWVVVSGTAEVRCNDRTYLLTENQSTYIPVGAVHRLTNPGKIPLEMIEVQSGSYLGEDDIERLEDIYGRNATPGDSVIDAGEKANEAVETAP